MPRNIVVGKVAIGPTNTLDEEISNILTPYVRKKNYQHFCSIWQHLAAKCAFRALQRVAYGID